ncbi:MAG: Rrf2 family transcriptional regulator [Gemmatimonadota bacterium]
MQLNDRTDFGLRLLLTLTGTAPRRWSARELAAFHGLSFTHVQKVVQQLDAAGFVVTVRGRGGGVALAAGTADRSIGDVVRALEPHVDLVRCLRDGESGCVLDGGCALTGVIVAARSAFFRELDNATLADVAARTPAVLL